MLLQLIQDKAGLGKNNPPSELAIALLELNWTRAQHLVNSPQGPKLCARFSTMHGFFDGLKDATVLPLHQACAVSQVPIELVKSMLRVYPKAVTKTESSYKRLPLHCAARTAADPALIQALLQAEDEFITSKGEGVGITPPQDGSNSDEENPIVVSACLKPDVLGRLPLHYALSNGANPATIKLLLQAAPQAGAGVDSRGWMPLHVAASVGCSVDVLKQVHTAYPQAVVMLTVQGSSPARCLHKTVPHRQELKAYLKQAKADYERKNPVQRSLSSSSSTTSSPKRSSPRKLKPSLQATAEALQVGVVNRDTSFEKAPLSRAASSPAVLEDWMMPLVAAGGDASATSSIQNPFDGIVSSSDQQASRGVQRSMSHDGLPAHRSVPSPTARRAGGRRPGNNKWRPLPIENSVFV